MSHKQLLKTALGCHKESKEEGITIQFRSPQRPFNKPVIGTSMLIGTKENLKSTEYWLTIFQDIQIDLMNYFCDC